MKTYYTMREVAVACEKSHSLLYHLNSLGKIPEAEATTSNGLQLWSVSQVEKIKALTANAKRGRPRKKKNG